MDAASNNGVDNIRNINEEVMYTPVVDNGVLFDTIDAIIKSDSTKLIEICEDINIQGRNLKQFVNDLVTHMRNVIVANSTKNGVGVLDYSIEYIERLNNQAKDMSMNTAKVIMKELSKLE